jgi:hypothetical protein
MCITSGYFVAAEKFKSRRQPACLTSVDAEIKDCRLDSSFVQALAK